MTSLKGGSAICIVLCMAMVSASSNHMSKDLIFGERHVIISKQSFNGTTLLYGACALSNSSLSDVSCEVILETFNFDGTSKRLACDVETKSLKTPYAVNIKVARVGRDKAVLVAVDESEVQHLHLVSVDLISCKTIHRKVEAPRSKTKWAGYELTVLGYERTYDVILYNYDRTIAADWMGTYDIEGNLLSVNSPWSVLGATPDFWTLRKLAYTLPDGGYVAARISENKTTLMFGNNNGSEILKEWDSSPRHIYTELFFDNNETFSLCTFNFDNYDGNCRLFEPHGVEKVEISLRNTCVLYLKSMPNGYIAAAIKRESESKELSLFVMRFNSDGQLVKEQHLKTLRANVAVPNTATQIFKNDDGMICISFVDFSYCDFFPGICVNKFTVTAECFADF